MSPVKNATPLPENLAKDAKKPSKVPVNRVLVVILLLLTVVFGVIVFVLVSGTLNQSDVATTPQKQNTVTPSPVASPSAQPADIEEEASLIDVGSGSAEQELENIQKDVEGL